jgi:ribosomal protein L37AE/L43A
MVEAYREVQVQLLNEMSPEERASREQEKRICRRCGRAHRQRVEQRTLTVIWNGEQLLPPRRFVNAHMRVIEEVWLCPECPGVPSGQVASGMWIDFAHIGKPDEIVTL